MNSDDDDDDDDDDSSFADERFDARERDVVKTSYARTDELTDYKNRNDVFDSEARPPPLLRDARSVGLEPVQQIGPRLASSLPARGS